MTTSVRPLSEIVQLPGNKKDKWSWFNFKGSWTLTNSKACQKTAALLPQDKESKIWWIITILHWPWPLTHWSPNGPFLSIAHIDLLGFLTPCTVWRGGWKLECWWQEKKKAKSNRMKRNEFFKAYAEAVLQAKRIFLSASAEAAKSCPKELPRVVNLFINPVYLQPALKLSTSAVKNYYPSLLKRLRTFGKPSQTACICSACPCQPQPTCLPKIQYIH